MSEQDPRLLPVLLSGGSGTRLWPLSREAYPKQFLPLAGEDTMLQDTWQRVAELAAGMAPVVVANEEHRFLAAEQLRQMGVEHATILLEPVGRNTAPAIAAAALQASAQGEDPLLLVLPSDHVVRSEEHTSELQSLMRNSYAVFCLKKKKQELKSIPIYYIHE